MKTLEQRIADLEARNEISELRSAYCWHTTRGEADAVRSLFVEEGIFQNIRGGTDGQPLVICGQAAMTEYFSRMRPARRIPVVMNEVTRVEGDKAEGTCVMVNHTDAPFCGHYIDDFAKVGGKWRFAVRRFYTYWPVYEPAPDRKAP